MTISTAGLADAVEEGFQETEQGYLISEEQLVELANKVNNLQHENTKLESIVESQEKEIKYLEELNESYKKEINYLENQIELERKRYDEILDDKEKLIETKNKQIENMEEQITDLRGTSIDDILKGVGVFSTGTTIGVAVGFLLAVK